jgi:hypothetical protein
MDTTLDDAAQVTAHDPEEMDTREDTNALRSTDDLTGDHGACGAVGKEVDRRPEPTTLQSGSTSREDVGSTEASSETIMTDESAFLTGEAKENPEEEHGGQPESPEGPFEEEDGGQPESPQGPFEVEDGGQPEPPQAPFEEEDGDQPESPEGPFEEEDGGQRESSEGPFEEEVGGQPESPIFGEDSEIFPARRSARLGSKGTPEGGAESRVSRTSGTGRSFSPRKIKKKVTNPKGMSPESDSEPGSTSPPVPMKSALKRKVPPEVEALLSGGSSTSKAIDVDALNAVLERFLVKRELQVRNFKMATSRRLMFFSM